MIAMAELKTVMAPLTGSNDATWKIQCRMALMKDGLWGIVSGSDDCVDRSTVTVVLTW